MFRIRPLLISLSLTFCSLYLLASEVSPQKAQFFAARFIQQSAKGARTELPGLALSFTKYTKAPSAQARQTAKPLYYVFNATEGGFVIVSADDAAYPILGYSDQGSFMPDSLPQAYVKWIAAYEKQLNDLVQQQSLPLARVAQAWETLERQSTTLGPLLTSTWDQSPHYNESCPYDSQAQKHAVTGCVATAMAQIMKYHQHPAKGIGFHSYDHSIYGTLSANFGLTEYAWDQMPDAINSSNEAVAQLNYHCGVSVNMDYGVNESGAGGAVLVRPALRKYFQYEAETAERGDYTTTEWIDLLKTELDAGRPIFYEGSGTGGGHAFVCDGYQGEDFFHFNWGWGGYMNGFFYINDLSPSDLGTGGGSGSFNSNQKVVYQIQPAESPVAITYNLELYGQTQVTPNPIPFTAPFQVEFTVANLGDTSFAGQFAVVVFDENNFQEVIDSIAIADLQPQTYKELTLTTGGLPVVSPGNYQLAILYKEEGQEWQLVESDTYSAYTDIEFLDSENDITLTTPLTLSSEIITQQEAVDLSFNIKNTGASTFSGIVAAGLYSLEGRHQVTIGSVNIPELTAGGTFAESLTIFSSGIDVEPGTYLLVMWTSDAQETTILASGGHDHPKRVVVQIPPPVADSYEDNNSEAHAFTLMDAMETDFLQVKTQGANQHTDVDYDYYQLTLPSGYDYEINARVQDGFDNDDGQEYTSDVVFSYRATEEWSEAFDTQIDSSIVVRNGGTLKFWVAPYFAGQQGTYALDIQITRQENVTITLTNANWDTLSVDSTYEIHWESNFTEPVTLALYQHDQYYAPIAEEIDNGGTYEWALADSTELGDQYQVVVFSSSDAAVRSESTYFAIVSPETASPSGSEDPSDTPAEPTEAKDSLSAPVAVVTSLPEEVPDPIVTVYPNPVRDQLYIDFGGQQPEIIEIVSAQGEVLRRLNSFSGISEVDLSYLRTGVYLLRCRWEAGSTQIYPLIKN